MENAIKPLVLFVAITLLLVLPPVSYSAPPSVAQIIRSVENNINGKTAFMKIVMIVTTKRTKRTVNMVSYSIGKEKSFIKITYPKKDKGITFLKVDNSMWQYVPRIEKTLKIPASMMLQGWMGSDFTNDDLVRASSISDDYQSRLLDEGDTFYEIELIPKKDAAVVWGRIVMKIDKALFLPTAASYYDEDNVLVRVLRYEDIKSFNAKKYPSRWVVVPHTNDKEGHQTIMEIKDLHFDEEIDPSYFTKRALKRFSR